MPAPVPATNRGPHNASLTPRLPPQGQQPAHTAHGHSSGTTGEGMPGVGRGRAPRPQAPAPSPAHTHGPSSLGSPLHGLWRFHHKGVIRSTHWPLALVPCAALPLEVLAAVAGAEPSLNPCLVFLGKNPTLPPSRALDTRRRISAQELLLAPLETRERWTRAQTDTVQPRVSPH